MRRCYETTENLSEPCPEPDEGGCMPRRSMPQRAHLPIGVPSYLGAWHGKDALLAIKRGVRYGVTGAVHWEGLGLKASQLFITHSALHGEGYEVVIQMEGIATDIAPV